MFRGRDARDADQPILDGFLCPSNGSHTADVEELIRELLAWRDDRSDRIVRLYDHHPAGDVVAVLAYEHLIPALPEHGVFVPVFAVARGQERRGVATDILGALVEHLQSFCPGGVIVFRVDCRNREMVALCMKYAGSEPSICEDDRDFYEWVVTVPQPD